VSGVERRDAVVLGGGFAGLAAALEAALQGLDVLLLERETFLGGKAGEVRDGGLRFDVGPSVVTLPGVLRAPFDAAGEAFPVALRPLEPLARYRFPSGRVLDLSSDVARTTAQLSAREARAYATLLEEARAFYEAAAPTFVHGPPPGPLRLARYGLRHGLRARPWARLPDLLAHHGATGELRDVFLRFATYFVVRAYADLARRLGVEIRTGVDVVGLAANEGGVRIDVRDADDPAGSVRVVQARRAVSTLDRGRTLRLLGRRAPEVPPSLSGMVVLLDVGRRDADAPLHTLSMPARYEREFEAIAAGRTPDDPTLYVAVSARGTPSDAPDGRENWYVMANAPALAGGVRVDEAAYADRIERLLVERGLLAPGDVRRVATRGPRDLARLATHGAIYGAAPHSLLATIRPSHRVRGAPALRLAGGTVHPGGGIPLAVTSGRGAVRDLLGGP
jgi:phytoene dehydrogenase-like protein